MKFDEAQTLARVAGTLQYRGFRSGVRKFARISYLTVGLIAAGLTGYHQWEEEAKTKAVVTATSPIWLSICLTLIPAYGK